MSDAPRGAVPDDEDDDEGDQVEIPDYASLDGAEVTNQDGEKLGKVEGLFVDDMLNVPTWAAVRSGLFGNRHSLVPLAQARFEDGKLFVPYSKDDLTIAPHHDPDQPLSADEEGVLFAHYNVGFSDADAPGPHTGVEAEDTGLTGPPEVGSHPVDVSEIEALVPDVPGLPGLPTTDTRLRRYQPAGGR